jgi:hypothetical protein
MPAGAGLASVGAQIGSSIFQGVNASNAEGAASKAATAASNANNAAASQVYQTNQNNLQPTVNAGQESTSALAGLLGIGGNPAASTAAFNNYLGSTNYNFDKTQGEQGIEYANAPSFNSGATAKALDTFNTGLAGNALAGYENQLNTVTNQGVSAAGTETQAGESYAGQIASDNNNAAGIAGTSALGAAGAQNAAVGGVLGAAQAGLTSSSFGGSGSSPAVPGGGAFTAGPASDPNAAALTSGNSIPVPSALSF